MNIFNWFDDSLCVWNAIFSFVVVVCCVIHSFKKMEFSNHRNFLFPLLNKSHAIYFTNETVIRRFFSLEAIPSHENNRNSVQNLHLQLDSLRIHKSVRK